MIISKNELFRYGLNLDYPRPDIDYLNQTNTTVSKIMNDFVGQYKNNFKDKKFILFYNDDIYSLIAYQILKNIQGIYPFTLQLYGKRKNTKKLINKKEFLTFLSKKSSIKNAIYISCFNPIYKVKNSKISFKELSNPNCYCIIDKFTPTQFRILSNFYHINDSKLLRDMTTKKFLDFDNFTLYRDVKNINSISKNSFYLGCKDFYNETINKITEINLIKFKGNKDDFTLFDKVLKNCDNKIYYYFYDKKSYQFLIENFNPYINSVNVINEYNSNTILQNPLKIQCNYIGDWTSEEILKNEQEMKKQKEVN